MKILTANFVTCAVKACKSSPDSFPLHFRDAELEQVEMEYNPAFIRNIMPRVEWEALKITAGELGFTTLPTTKPESSTSQPPPAASEDNDTAMTTDPSTSTSTSASHMDPSLTSASASADASPDTSPSDKLWHDLHTLLLETHVVSGKMVCGSCGHEYRIRDGIANFLLPNHLV